MARPFLPEDELKKFVLPIRFSQKEITALTKLANKNNMNLTQMIRYSIKFYAVNKPKSGQLGMFPDVI